MSYPSIKKILEEKGVDINSTSENELKEHLWDALRTDLKLGVDYLMNIAEEVRSTGKKVLKPEDPNSELGKKLIRLLGTDVARDIMEEKTGIAFGFYNCCGVVGAIDREQLELTAKEQIMLQDGTIASADC